MSLKETIKDVLGTSETSEAQTKENVDNHPDDFSTNEPDRPSEYDVDVDHGRLQKSATIHAEQDEQVLKTAYSWLDDAGVKQPLQVLDAGCGYGTVTESRFGGEDGIEVRAVDISEDAIQVARSWHEAGNISYKVTDLTRFSESAEYDLVFAAYLFHHLDQGTQIDVLRQLWDSVRPGGVLVVRSCDDGQHLYYSEDEEEVEQMEWLVDVTDEIQGSSDRTHGRRVPVQVRQCNPQPKLVELNVKNYSTVGMDSEGRQRYWDVFHSNRRHYAERLAERSNATESDADLRDRVTETMDEFKKKFVEQEDFTDMKTVPVTIAQKPQ